MRTNFARLRESTQSSKKYRHEETRGLEQTITVEKFWESVKIFSNADRRYFSPKAS